MTGQGIKILWVDDEIDLLSAPISFIENKGYRVTKKSNGIDALELLEEERFDIVLLDEQMPGMSGIEILQRIKEKHTELPVIMITKSEAEDLMDLAIGAKIEDYLIKPIKPQQLLLTLKKTAEKNRLTQIQTVLKYQQDFSRLSGKIMNAATFDDWVEIYRLLTFWDLELEELSGNEMSEVLSLQHQEANREFSRFIAKNYPLWISGKAEKPVLSQSVLDKWFFPNMTQTNPPCLLVIDNLRYDLWRLLSKLIREFYVTEEEHLYCSILPSATQYARNALFSGLMPIEIFNTYPQYWIFDEEEGGKNQFEEILLQKHMKRKGIDNRVVYRKISNQQEGKKVLQDLPNLLNSGFVTLVYNFVDILSHTRTEMDMIKELTKDIRAFRELARSWFKNSYLLDTIRLLSERNIPLAITTDHGSIEVETPVKVIGDRDSTTNIRYKLGRNLKYNENDVLSVVTPETFMLPKNHMTSRYIFARENTFFVYPKNYNHFVRYFKGTFQHGGISLEEMLIPFTRLSPKK